MNKKDRQQLSEEFQRLNELSFGGVIGIALSAIIVFVTAYLIIKERKDRKEALKIAIKIAPKIKEEVDKIQKTVVPELFSIGSKLYSEISGSGFITLYNLLDIDYENVELLKNKSNYNLTEYIKGMVYYAFKSPEGPIFAGFFYGPKTPFNLDSFLSSFSSKITQMRAGKISDDEFTRVKDILKSFTLDELYKKVERSIDFAENKSSKLLTNFVKKIYQEVEKVLKEYEKE